MVDTQDKYLKALDCDVGRIDHMVLLLQEHNQGAPWPVERIAQDKLQLFREECEANLDGRDLARL